VKFRRADVSHTPSPRPRSAALSPPPASRSRRSPGQGDAARQRASARHPARDRMEVTGAPAGRERCPASRSPAPAAALGGGRPGFRLSVGELWASGARLWQWSSSRPPPRCSSSGGSLRRLVSGRNSGAAGRGRRSAGAVPWSPPRAWCRREADAAARSVITLLRHIGIVAYPLLAHPLGMSPWSMGCGTALRSTRWRRSSAAGRRER